MGERESFEKGRGLRNLSRLGLRIGPLAAPRLLLATAGSHGRVRGSSGCTVTLRGAFVQEGGQSDHFCPPLGPELGLWILSAVIPPRLPSLPCDTSSKVRGSPRWLHRSIFSLRSRLPPSNSFTLRGWRPESKQGPPHACHTWGRGDLMTAPPPSSEAGRTPSAPGHPSPQGSPSRPPSKLKLSRRGGRPSQALDSFPRLPGKGFPAHVEPPGGRDIYIHILIGSCASS